MQSARTLVWSCLSMLAAIPLATLPSIPVAAFPAELDPMPPSMPSPSEVLRSLSTSGRLWLADSSPAASERTERTGAPYFYVAGGDPDVDRLPLKETHAQVAIAGTIASVEVRQVFENAGRRPI